MNLTLQRTMFRDDGIFGELRDENGSILFLTLEHNFDGKPKLADGVYNCVRGTHTLEHDPESFITFEIENVPPFQGHLVTKILFHRGNYDENSNGCVLLGKKLGWRLGGKIRMITYSKQACKEFMELQKYVDSFTLTVQS